MPTATYKALSPNFIVRVSKKNLTENREGDKVYYHQAYVWYTRNLQCGEIVSISDAAKKEMPMAEIGDILIFHHFIEASAAQSEMDSSYVVDETKDDYYFNVSAMETAGEMNQSYGIFKNGVIIPHPQYTFLEKEQPVEVSEFSMSKDEIIAKLNKVKETNLYHMNNSAPNEDLRNEVRKTERESLKTTQELNKKQTQPFIVAFASEDKGYEKGGVVYALNIAANILVTFNSVEYRVIESKYIKAT